MSCDITQHWRVCQELKWKESGRGRGRGSRRGFPYTSCVLSVAACVKMWQSWWGCGVLRISARKESWCLLTHEILTWSHPVSQTKCTTWMMTHLCRYSLQILLALLFSVILAFRFISLCLEYDQVISYYICTGLTLSNQFQPVPLGTSQK